jgi:dynein assembly factor 2
VCEFLCCYQSDYVADLQNPEYRAETEAYIGQLESEDKVPAGKELIRPEKGFVAKSRKRDLKDKEDTKVFINIVQSEKITKPTKTDTDKGQNWSLPYSLGPPHMEKDKVG